MFRPTSNILRNRVRRRRFLQALGASASMGAAGTWMARAAAERSRGGRSASSRSALQEDRSPRFLFVITAYGGADLTDSFLPVAASQVSSPEIAQALRVYPDELIVQPPGSAFRCVRNLASDAPEAPPFRGGSYELSDFVRRHGDDMSVVTVENSSVNHVVAQGRSVTGDSIDGGRTIMEAIAETHGGGVVLPNCNMSNAGYTINGARPDTPDDARAVLISDARHFGLGTHGYRGVLGAPPGDQLERARDVRRGLEAFSPLEVFSSSSDLRSRYRQLGEQVAPGLEADLLIDKLLLVGDRPDRGGYTDQELETFGLRRSPEFGRLQEYLPDLGGDDLQAQAALAFLLAKYGLASSLTFGLDEAPYRQSPDDLTLLGSPVAFDFAHSNHVLSQNINWVRMMEVVDALITLLKEEPHGNGSMWDQSLVYIATDFGRTKDRPVGSDLWSFGSAHDLNNGVVVISPKIKGNRVFGGIDPDTLLTYGYDPGTGDPVPGSRMTSGHVYSLVCQALGVDFPGRHDMSGLLR